MKKLLVTGGVLFAVMPAMALDLPSDLIAGSASINCSSTQDPEFAVAHDSEHPMDMQALYMTNACSAGQYLVVSGENATFDNDGILENATCTPCPVGSYCEGSGQSGYEIGAQLASSYGIDACPAGTYNNLTNQTSLSACQACTGATYAEGTGNNSCTNVQAGYFANADHSGEIQCTEGYRDGAGASSSAGCTGNCSLNALDYGSNDHVSTYTLVDHNGDNGATVRFNTDYVPGVSAPDLAQVQFCEKIVATCDPGYEKTSVPTIIGNLKLTSNDITYTRTPYTTEWTATMPASTSPVTSVGGVYMCKDSVAVSGKVGCFMRGIYLNGHPINGNTLEVTQYNTTDACYANCGDIANTNIAAFFDDATTADGNRFAKLVGDRYMCIPGTIYMDWGDVENAGDAATCTYGEGFTAPSAPTPEAGYKFLGWKVTSTTNND